MPPRLLLALAAILFSTGGAAIKATALTSWQTAGLRSGVAAAALALLLSESRRGWGWKVVPPAISYAACLTLFVHANKLTTAANAIFLQSTAPAWLLLLGPLVLKEPVRRKDWVFAGFLALGMSLFFLGVPERMATAPDQGRGNFYALLSGFFYAWTIAGLRWLARSGDGEGALATVTLGNIFAFAAALPMALPVAVFTPRDAAVIGYLGIVQIGVAYVCLTRGMRRVKAFEASAILLLEPVLNPVWAWIVQGERIGTFALTGGAIIIVSTLWHARQERA